MNSHWLRYTPFDCKIKTSPKVQHYIPHAEVSSYSNTGSNPWTEVALMSPVNSTAQGGGDGTTHHPHENNFTGPSEGVEGGQRTARRAG